MTTRKQLGGLYKRCPRNPETGRLCPRKRWSECSHPWYIAFSHNGQHHRFNLNKRAGKPRHYVMSRTEAESLHDLYRSQIRAGTFGEKPRLSSGTDARLTMRDVSKPYDERYINAPSRRSGAKKTMSYYMAGVMAVRVLARGGTTVALGDKVLADISKADIEALRTHWQTRDRKLSKGGLVGVNRMLRRVRHFFNWAVEDGHIDESPFHRNGRAVIKLDRTVETGRTRRLEPGEEDSIMKHASAYSQQLMKALLDTGCRVGELLNLCWRDVRMEDNRIVLQAQATKSNRARSVPVSKRVKAILEMRRHGPDGKELGADCYVFGTETGERRKSVSHDWNIAVLRAHDHEPTFKRGKLDAASRKVLQKIDLHMHDLRRECGSRMLEAGVPIHEIRDWLGHKDIGVTDRYLAITGVSLQGALKKVEARQNVLARKNTPNKSKSTRPATSHVPGDGTVTVN